ncbi:FAD-binding oxidoreductase [Caenimonas sp. SL110]|uniref:NAD(P)/FAD-dependent oxidoreductase n=1 Tax=Caenimonas sp. SL110 TaxID=1450524 RepID=UPI000653F409|nr:FAD-dependent oxidoreductase [Caenimonas sp. SL110]
MQSPTKRFDIAIIGGGLMGCSAAHFIRNLAPDASVAVIEPDPTYEFASTPRASGGCRVQFTCPENIELSKASIEFIKTFAQHMAIADAQPDVGWIEGGYLFVVPPEHVEALAGNVKLQNALGCEVNLLTPQELKAKFPSMNVQDLGAGAHSPRDGWCDPHSLLWGFRRKAASQGVDFVKGRVVAIDVDAAKVRALRLDDGSTIAADTFINAAGAWSGQVAAMAGMNLPIAPMKRYEHYFTPASPMERLPYVKDIARLAFRSEGNGFSGGLVDGSTERGFDFEVDHDYFERVVWPAVAHRFPPLEAAKCHRTWAGLYEECELDGNAVIGRWNNGLANLLVVAGFSGHGMMHAPAAGRAIAELVVHGSYQTLDLTRLGYERVEQNQPYRETGII